MAEVGAQSTQLDFHQAMQDFRVMFPDMDSNVIEAVLRSNHGAVHATIDQLLTMTTDLEADLLWDRRPHPPPQRAAASLAVPDVVAGVMRRGGGASPGWDGRGQASALRPPHRDCLSDAQNEQPPSYALLASPPPSYHQAVPGQHRSSGRCSSSTSSSNGSQPTSSPPCLRRSFDWRPPLLLPLPADFLRLPLHHTEVRHFDTAAKSTRSVGVDQYQYMRASKVVDPRSESAKTYAQVVDACDNLILL